MLCLLVSDKIVTASFDATAKVWNASTGNCLNTLNGHTAELVAAEFHPLHSHTITTASMDGTARIFHVETGQELQTLNFHGAEVIASRFNREGNLLLTGSFDRTAIVWDQRMQRYMILIKYFSLFKEYLLPLESLKNRFHVKQNLDKKES